MSSFRESLKNRAYLYGSATMLLFFASWGIWWSFFQIWLTSEAGGLMLSGAKVGTIFSINSAAALAFMLIYGIAQDRLDLKRHLVIFVSAVMTLIGPFANFVYRPMLESNFYAGAIIGAIVLAAGFVGSAGLFEAYVERISRRHNFEFGQARMWGSFGYAVVALVAGFLFTINPALNFWLGSVFGAVTLLIQLFWRTSSRPSEDGQAKPSVPSFGEMAGLLKDKNLWMVIVFVLFSWTFYTVFDQQMFPDFYTSLFADQASGQHAYGILNSFQVFLEALMMGVVPVIMRKVGARNTLLLGVTVMFLRISLCGLLDGAVFISFVKLFHALEVPLFVLGVFKYFSLHFNPAVSATLYLVGFSIASQVGTIILSNPLGQLRDSIGYQSTFHIISGVVLVAGVYAFFALRKDSQAINVSDDAVATAPADDAVPDADVPAQTALSATATLNDEK